MLIICTEKRLRNARDFGGRKFSKRTFLILRLFLIFFFFSFFFFLELTYESSENFHYRVSRDVFSYLKNIFSEEIERKNRILQPQALITSKNFIAVFC